MPTITVSMLLLSRAVSEATQQKVAQSGIVDHSSSDAHMEYTFTATVCDGSSLVMQLALPGVLVCSQ